MVEKNLNIKLSIIDRNIYKFTFADGLYSFTTFANNVIEAKNIFVKTMVEYFGNGINEESLDNTVSLEVESVMTDD